MVEMVEASSIRTMFGTHTVSHTVLHTAPRAPPPRLHLAGSQRSSSQPRCTACFLCQNWLTLREEMAMMLPAHPRGPRPGGAPLLHQHQQQRCRLIPCCTLPPTCPRRVHGRTWTARLRWTSMTGRQNWKWTTMRGHL